MTDLQNITTFTATQLRRLITTRQLSPVEVMEAHLQNIEQQNDLINAICTLSDRAMDDARQAESAIMAGRDFGLLHGLPVGIKEVTDTAGLRTTYGSPLYADHVPTADALIVQRIKQAGGIIIGKTNVPEFALGANTYNDLFGPTRNPWNTDLTAGGSTGGGAAGLATGMITLAEGSDLGGSLRLPAVFCGVVGLRPSPGLVPTYPSWDVWETINVNGPMARTAEDVALMLQAIAGPSPLIPLNQPIFGRDFIAAVQAESAKGTRVAYCRDVANIGVDDEVAQLCRAGALSLAEAGAIVEEIELDLSFAWPAFLDIRGAHVLTHHYHHLDKLDQLGPNIRGNVEAGLNGNPNALAEAQRTRTQVWQTFYDLWQTYDAVLTPCGAIPPFPVAQNYPQTISGKAMNSYIDWIAPTFLLSLSGLPIAAVPCGLTASRLPVGLQVVGPQFGEEAVLALARQIQQLNPIGLPQVAS